MEYTFSVKNVKPVRPSTPTAQQTTMNAISCLKEYFERENLPLSLHEPTRERGTCWSVFRRGRCNCNGPVIISGMSIDEDVVTPLKVGDCPSTSNIENKQPVNAKSFHEHEHVRFESAILRVSTV